MPKQLYAKAVFSYRAQGRDEISFNEGEFLEVYNNDSQWWEGKVITGGPVGLFPGNRVQKIAKLPAGVGGGSRQTLASGSVAPGTRVNRKQTNFPNLARCPPDQQIKKVSVVFKEFKRNKRTTALYVVEVTTKQGGRGTFKTEKSMIDFRQLYNSILLVFPAYRDLITKELPPPWADELPLTTFQAKQRAKQLAKFLARNVKERAFFDLAILTWAKLEKPDLQSQIPTQNSLGRMTLNTSDTGRDAQDKLLDAMKYNYNFTQTAVCFRNQRSSKGIPIEGWLAQVQYEWTQQDDVEISLDELEYFLITSQDTKFDGWWYGEKYDGRNGIFPSSYAKILEGSEIAQIRGEKKKRRKKNKRYSRNPTGASKGNFNSSNVSVASSTSRSSRKPERSMGTNYNKPGPPGPPRPVGGRARKIIPNFTVTDIKAYDELREQGVTLADPMSGQRYPYSLGSRNNKKGYVIVASYDAFVWDPQTLQLREFASSDQLEAPPEGVSQGKAGVSGAKLNILIGGNEVNEGLELGLNQNCCSQGKTVRIVVAPFKGYGETGSPPEIPRDCYLVYDITIEDMKKESSGQIRRPRDQVLSVGIARPMVQQNIRKKKKGKR